MTDAEVQCTKPVAIGNTLQARKKEEAMVAAREEMKAQTLREMALKAELERVSAALPASQAEVGLQAKMELVELMNDGSGLHAFA